MRAMTLQYFQSLLKRDFENGLVRDEIERAMQEREWLLEECERVHEYLNEGKYRSGLELHLKNLLKRIKEGS